ncbi:hypothetical protein MATL_G00185990 [Megalops atlanticus]|uniref:Potassium channel domain-containing protein n=1 Tax=Megalops atlanticus TaxID=7932 RepID=A0A9D3PMM7_MEGAT|nr:hypothetical protein MATL_G00185990 [Megalops atlanticus]
MSVAAEEGRSLEERSRCSRLLSILFPLACLFVLLVSYAALGALLFEYIEGGSDHTKLTEEYREFLRGLVNTVQNPSDNSSSTEDLMQKVNTSIIYEFKSKWLQRPARWNFYGSMFFCCTVFTTVGYGEIYPVTITGKVVCILYAMVGIPLMLLVITDVGDILAMLVSKAYMKLHLLCPRRPPCRWPFRKCQEKPAEGGVARDGAYTFSQDLVIREPLDIKQVLRSQASVKRKSVQLRNIEIFDRIIARENLSNFTREAGLPRTLSCPELNQIPAPKDHGNWDLSEIGKELDKLDVPLVVILVLFFTYILFGSLLLPLWETDIDRFDAFYFCFITLTTIGFGDIVPRHPKFFMLTSLFIIVGMAILSMAFKLGQSRIVSCYRQCIGCISRGKVKTYQQLEGN